MYVGLTLTYASSFQMLRGAHEQPQLNADKFFRNTSAVGSELSVLWLAFGYVDVRASVRCSVCAPVRFRDRVHRYSLTVQVP